MYRKPGLPLTHSIPSDMVVDVPLYRFKTGHGIGLGDSRRQVVAVYGRPDSDSTKLGGEKMQWIYRGPEYPYIYTVSLKQDKVYQIELAAGP